MKSLITSFVLIIILGSFPAFAAEIGEAPSENSYCSVTFKNGNKLEGRILEQDDSGILLEVQSGTMRIPQPKIKSISVIQPTEKAGAQVPVSEKVIQKKLPPAPKDSGIKLFDLSLIDKAVTAGHGAWSVSENTLNVYSWSYGLPGIFVIDADADNATIEATLCSGDVGPHAWQGLALCLNKENGEYHGTPSFVARYYEGQIQIVDCVTNFKTNKGTVIASAPASLETSTEYALKLTVKDGNFLSVALNGKEVLTHTVNRQLHGACSLVAANGNFSFKNIRTMTNESKKVSRN